jgi:chromosome segregation ATPase
MANASSTEDASKASQASERRVLFYAVGVAVIIVAGAVAYRIATAEGDLDVVGGKEGLSVKITQISEAQRTIESANEELKAAQQQLAEAKQRLTDRETALGRAEAELREKERRIQQLLQKIEAGGRRPTLPELSDARAELRKLQAEPPARAAIPAAPTDALERRVSKIDDLQRKLARTNQSLKQ